ncbi:MAG: tRNA (N6-threonylcarbamoyladenosine(37)-N6)-methyltransferase TrmO [Acidimicrobiaceae bacterium]
MSEAFRLDPIGVVHSSRGEAIDDNWDDETSSIRLLSPYGSQSVRGLETFSHCMVIYVFDRATWDESRMSRHPRGNTEWPEVGIFSQRAKDRPNRLGVAVCQVLEVDGDTIRVSGLDAIDGTPIVDIKPWMVEFGPRGEVSQPRWAGELMKDYW